MLWKDCRARCNRRVHTLEEGRMLMLLFERAFDYAEALLFEWSTLYGIIMTAGRSGVSRTKAATEQYSRYGNKIGSEKKINIA